jgi:hypothetical protein
MLYISSIPKMAIRMYVHSAYTIKRCDVLHDLSWFVNQCRFQNFENEKFLKKEFKFF